MATMNKLLTPSKEDESVNYEQLDEAIQPRCPLCGCINASQKARIRTDLISKMYGKDRRDLVRQEFMGTPWIYVYRCEDCSLSFFEPKIAGSPAFYEGLQSSEWYYQKDKREYEMAARWIPPKARVLEVGCGAGWFAKRIPHSQYRGLEYSASATEMARASGLDVRTQSVEEHSRSNRLAYQVVCAFQVLEHVPDPGAFIAACLDCLEPGGLLIYGVPSDDSYMRFLQNAPLNLPPHHLTRWPDATLESIPKIFSITLESIEHETVSDIHLIACVSAMIRRRLCLILGRREAMVDRSFAGRLVNRFSGILAKNISSVLSDPVLRPRGQTVVVIYRKQVPSV